MEDRHWLRWQMVNIKIVMKKAGDAESAEVR